MFTVGMRNARLRRDHLRLRTVDLGRVRGGIDGDQKFTGLDQRTLLKVRRVNGTCDTRADIDAFDCLQASGEFVPGADVGGFDGRDRDGRGLRRAWPWGRLGAGTAQADNAGGDGSNSGECGTSEQQPAATARGKGIHVDGSSKSKHGKEKGNQEHDAAAARYVSTATN